MAVELAENPCLTASLRDGEVLFQGVLGDPVCGQRLQLTARGVLTSDLSTEAESEVHESVFPLER